MVRVKLGHRQLTFAISILTLHSTSEGWLLLRLSFPMLTYDQHLRRNLNPRPMTLPLVSYTFSCSALRWALTWLSFLMDLHLYFPSTQLSSHRRAVSVTTSVSLQSSMDPDRDHTLCAGGLALVAQTIPARFALDFSSQA